MRVIVASEDAETSRGHGGLLASSRMDYVPSSSPITTTQLGANDSQTVLEESSAACINKEQDEDDEEDAEAEAEEEENKDDERRRATTSDDEYLFLLFTLYPRVTLNRAGRDLTSLELAKVALISSERDRRRVGSSSRGPRWLQLRAGYKAYEEKHSAECHSTSS
ncbi:hypothetical protein HZH66_010959 [Vespula vulgaris]|uniref:Uncharacterized protein n=1 Tax=Vespula vulgaris TaxID=7454 RepID=A0A834JHV9_VESVU|nr:hypothetical protein HZH66_010959 [Vespula vulgaris]